MESRKFEILCICLCSHQSSARWTDTNNGTQSPEEKLIVWRPKNPEKYLIKARMNVFAETKTNEGKEIYENILGKEILSRKRERKGDFGNVVMDLHL